MENKVTDEDFVMILITSLPESWDQYTSAYLGSSSNMPTLKSHELVAIYNMWEGGVEWEGDGISKKLIVLIVLSEE